MLPCYQCYQLLANESCIISCWKCFAIGAKKPRAACIVLYKSDGTISFKIHKCSLNYKQIHMVIPGSLSNDDRDAKDNALSKMNWYFISRICYCPDLFSTPMALKHAQAKYVMTVFNSKRKDEKLAAIVHYYAERGHFTMLFAEDSKEM